MTQRIIETPWADTGAITDPGASKTATGWIAEIPTHQNFNWLLHRADEAIQNAQATGIEPWHALVIFQDQGLTMGSDSIVYQSQQGSNLNHQPVGDDGTWWRTLSTLPPVYIDGLTISNNATTPDSKLDIGPGLALNAINTGVMELAAAITKQLDVDWAEGDDVGGKASSIISLAADTWYPVFAISKVTGATDGGIDTSLVAANLLSDAAGSGYVWYRRIGWVLTDATSDIEKFYVDPSRPDFVKWSEGHEDYGVTDIDKGAATVTAHAPPNTTYAGVLEYRIFSTTDLDTYLVWLSAIAEADFTPGGQNAHLKIFTDGDWQSNVALPFEIPVDASSQFRMRHQWSTGADPAAINLDINAKGYFDSRGV